MRQAIANFLDRRGFAVACVVAPILLGVFGNQFLASWLNQGSQICAVSRALPFALLGETSPAPLKLSDEDAKNCDARIAARSSEAAPMTAPNTQAAAPPLSGAAGEGEQKSADKPTPWRLQIVANHIAGRLNVAYAYAFLVLVSVVAFGFGSYVVISKKGWAVWSWTFVVFAIATGIIAVLDINRGALRGFVADNILARADADALLQFLPAANSLRSLIVGGLGIGYLSVGMILAALFVASVRKCEKSTLDDLKGRLLVIRVGLVLGSAILIVVVLSSRAVFDWPLSLLAEPDRKALMPAADALVRKWGAIGSISLIGAFLPAITAWYLDRDCYRNAPQPAKEAKPMPDEGELEIAPMSMVTSIVVILGPIIASPMFDAFKSLVSTLQK
jgi:hypothetical protein